MSIAEVFLLLMFIIWIGAKAEGFVDPAALRVKIERLQRQVEELTTKVKDLEDRNEALRRMVAQKGAELGKCRAVANSAPSDPNGKLSNIPPSCTGGPLGRVTIVGSDDFLVSGERVGIRTIEARHAADFAWAESNKCRHRAIVKWSESLSANELDAGMKRLERRFYIQRAGSVEIR